MNYKQSRQKPKRQIEKTYNYRFFNQGIQYICEVTAPISVPEYRVKEVFNNNFVGKGNKIDVFQPYPCFKSLHKDITYEVKCAKETN